MKLSKEELIKESLELAIPEYPEVERTGDKEEEFKNMIHELYINSLTRGQKRKLMNKQYKFSNQIRKQLNKKK